jgi:hypothetical protein
VTDRQLVDVRFAQTIRTLDSSRPESSVELADEIVAGVPRDLAGFLHLRDGELRSVL